MGKLNIEQSLEVKTNAAKAWEIIGPNFLNISHWGCGVLKSWNNDTLSPKFENAPAGGRYCEVVGFGKFDEKIIHYSNDKFEITWSAEGEKLPKFVSGLQNEIKVEKTDDHNCRITSNISANLGGIMGSLMGSYFKKNFTKQISGFLKDWKTYAETGEVSEAKKIEATKYQK